MMNIAYLISTYPMPSQTFIRREIAALEGQGLRIYRFALRRFVDELVESADRTEEQRTYYILDDGVSGLMTALVLEVLTRPLRWVKTLAVTVGMGWRSESGLIRHLIYFAEASVLRRRLAERSVQRLHAHFGTNSATVALLCRLLGGPPYSFTIHGPEEFDAPRSLALRQKVRHASFVVAISQFTCSQIYRWVDYLDWSRIHLVYLGVNPTLLEHGPVPIPATPRLVHIGRIVEQKGQAILIQAVARLLERGYDFELVMIGGGLMRSEIERLIDELGLRGRVRLTGYLNNQEVFQEILAARALVMPSFAEGLPVVLLEALALGRPVITTFIAGHPELIEPGVNGWLVPAGAVEPLAEAIAEVLTSDPAHLERMGRAGAARVAEQHDPRIAVEKLMDLFFDRGHAHDPIDFNRPSHQAIASAYPPSRTG